MPEESWVFLVVCYYHVTYEFQSESTLYSLPECQGTPFSYLKFKWQQRDLNPQPLSSWMNTQTFSQAGLGWAFVYELNDCGFESRCWVFLFLSKFLREKNVF